MTTYKWFIRILMVLLLAFEARAQEIPEVLLIDDAVNLALEYNFDLKVAQKSTEISNNNVTSGNAGYLPTVTLSGNYNYNVANTKTAFTNPELPPIDASGAATTGYGTGVNLNYNIYSGGSRNYTYKRLQTAQLQNRLQERQVMEQVVTNVIGAYLETVNQLDAFEIAVESVKISQDRYTRAEEGYGVGNLSRLEMMNAEVDLSNDSTVLVQSELNYEKARKSLSNMIGISPEADYDVSGDFSYVENLVVEQLLEQAMTSNVGYLLSRNAVTDSELNLDLSRAGMLPRLDLSGGYNYSRTTYDANFIESSRSLGWNAGVTLSYNLFDGGNRKREQQNAKILMESQEVNLLKSENDLKTNILNRYNDYTTSLKLITLSQRNLNLAQSNYNRSKEAFGVGQISGIELREAQLNMTNALYNLSVQRVLAKQAEVNLYAFTGTLVN